MRNINAKIKIISRQDNGLEKEESKTFCDGTYICKDGAYYIFYNDSDFGMEDTSTMIKVHKDGTVKMKRHGKYEAYMVYKNGVKHNFKYIMPYGSVDMVIHTKRTVTALSETGGSLRLLYRLDSGTENVDADVEILVELLN